MNAKVAASSRLWPARRHRARASPASAPSAAGFALPEPGQRLRLPRRPRRPPAVPHRVVVRHRQPPGPDGTPYGLQWTLFRTALAPGGAPERPALDGPRRRHHARPPTTSPSASRAAAPARRASTPDPFEAWIDEWRFAGIDDGTLTAQGRGLGLRPRPRRDQGPLVLQGDGGYSVKSEDGQASALLLPALLRRRPAPSTSPTGDVAVTGTAWLDREWSSQPLADRQVGWDWFSLSPSTPARS